MAEMVLMHQSQVRWTNTDEEKQKEPEEASRKRGVLCD
jgi:hypothetical protein